MGQIRRFLSALGWAVLLALLLVGCSSGAEIVGRWEKQPPPTPTPHESADPLADVMGDLLGGMFAALGDAAMPAQIEFFDDGKYAGSQMSIFPGGEYKIVDDGQIRLATAQGVIVLGFSINGETLTMTDESGYVVQYRRVE